VRQVEITGVGRTCSEEKWSRGLVDLAVEAAGFALADAGGKAEPTALVVSNAYGGALGDQRNLAAFLATRLGLGAVETHSVSADEASGGSAVRLGLALVQSGLHEAVMVVGAEKTSDALPDRLEAVRATGLDAVREAGFGFGPAVASGLGMQRYIEAHGVDRALFYHLARTAHHHAALNRLAFFSWELNEKQYLGSPTIAHPLTVCDQAPACDGAAALILGKPTGDGPRIAGSSSVSAPTGIGGPIESLELPAASRSARDALARAGMTIGDMSLAELHDSSSFIAALSIEAVGLAEKGAALHAAARDDFVIGGRCPLWTFGGLKARGSAPGAAGVYQIVEAAMQVSGRVRSNAVEGASAAFVQCLGSFGATAVSHVIVAG